MKPLAARILHPPSFIQELSGDPNPRTFSKVLPYKWEVYCRTNGRCTVGFSFLQGLQVRKVQRYKWGAYCRTNWRCTAAFYSGPVGVRASETLLIYTPPKHLEAYFQG